jgi:peptidoglycan biosynthesis protein MviN/MurJ (putative lipid II flippase)
MRRGLYHRMGIAAAIVAGGVLVSRLLGLVRQVVFAWMLGRAPPATSTSSRSSSLT